MAYIQHSKIGAHITSLVVNRPEVRNALNWEAMEEFSAAVRSLKTDPDLRVLLLSGAGRAFVSGADLSLVGSLKTRADGERLSGLVGEALAEMRSLDAISIAVIDGPARGGGAEIAVSCDLRFMSEDATIGFVQASLGLMPGWGGANRLYGLVGYARALELLATTRSVSAVEAHQMGLVNGVFHRAQLWEKVNELAEKIAANDWRAVRTAKQMLLSWEGGQDTERRSEERKTFLDLWDRDERMRYVAALRDKRGSD